MSSLFTDKYLWCKRNKLFETNTNNCGGHWISHHIVVAVLITA